jgi:hypothetical protein
MFKKITFLYSYDHYTISSFTLPQRTRIYTSSCRGRNVSLVLKKPFICSCCYNLNTRIFKKRRIVRTSAVKCKVKFCDFADIKIVIGAFAMYFF